MTSKNKWNAFKSIVCYTLYISNLQIRLRVQGWVRVCLSISKHLSFQNLRSSVLLTSWEWGSTNDTDVIDDKYAQAIRNWKVVVVLSLVVVDRRSVWCWRKRVHNLSWPDLDEFLVPEVTDYPKNKSRKPYPVSKCICLAWAWPSTSADGWKLLSCKACRSSRRMRASSAWRCCSLSNLASAPRTSAIKALFSLVRRF